MMSLFNTPFNSVILIVLVIAYNIVAGINNYDVRLIREKKDEFFLANTKTLPKWIGYIRLLEPIILVVLLFLNWKFALIAYIIKAILQALLVLEFIGYIMLYPFNIKR